MELDLLESTSTNKNNCPGVFSFDGTHTRSSLKKYKGKHRKFYKNNTISYTLNSKGYRCPEFNDVDWKNSIVIFGCSQTYGVGVDDTETYSHFLSKKLDIPVVNLGMGGTSIWYHVYNLKKIAPLGPKHTILQIPDPSRFTIFGCDKKTDNIGIWSELLHKHFFKIYNNNQINSKIYLEFAIDYMNKLLPNGLTYTFSLESHNSITVLDVARDSAHIGPETHENIADVIISERFLNKIHKEIS